jgi:hypothetical protein
MATSCSIDVVGEPVNHKLEDLLGAFQKWSCSEI